MGDLDCEATLISNEATAQQAGSQPELPSAASLIESATNSYLSVRIPVATLMWLVGRTEHFVPGSTAIPRAANVTRAYCSDVTGTQMHSPSPAWIGMPRWRSASVSAVRRSA